MGLLTFALDVTLDGCNDHREAIADDELLDYFTQLMDSARAMLFGRTTYELMEDAWPVVARDEKAPRAMREWARKLPARGRQALGRARAAGAHRRAYRLVVHPILAGHGPTLSQG